MPTVMDGGLILAEASLSDHDDGRGLPEQTVHVADLKLRFKAKRNFMKLLET